MAERILKINDDMEELKLLLKGEECLLKPSADKVIDQLPTKTVEEFNKVDQYLGDKGNLMALVIIMIFILY